MAQNGIPSASVMAKTAALLDMQGEWRTIRDPKTAQRRIVMPNLTGTRVYYVDPAGRGCSCKAGQNGLLCAHRLAVIERANQEALTTWVEDMVKPRTYASMFPACTVAGCTEIAESGRVCDDHAAAEVRRLDQERKRELVAAGGRR